MKRALVLISLLAASTLEAAITPVFPRGVEAGFLFRATALPAEARPAPETLLFDVDDRGRPFFLLGRTLVPLYTHGDDPKRVISPIPLLLPQAPGSFAFMRDGALLVVSGRELGAATIGGFQKLIDLPAERMRIAAADRNQLYLFGGDSPTQQRRLYLARRDGKIVPLFEAPAPITAVAGFGDLTFVSIGKMILYLRFGEPLVPLYRADEEIVALAVAPPGGLFAATASTLYYIHDNQTAWVAARGSVVPQVSGDTLFLFDRNSGDVLTSRPTSAFAERSKALEQQRLSEKIIAPIPPAAQQQFEKGMQAAEKQAWRRATEAFNASRKEAPYAPQILFNLGIAYSKRGLELPAMAWLQAYLAATPDGPQASMVRRELARLARTAERKVALVSRVSKQIHEDLEGAGVRPGTLRDYARLDAQLALASGNFAAAKAAVDAVADIGDRDAVWAALAETMSAWHADAEIARQAASQITDGALREASLAKLSSLSTATPAAGDSLEAVRHWAAFADFVSSRSEAINLEAELRRASKAETKEIPVRMMEIAANFGCNYLRMRNVQSRYPVMMQ